MTDTKPTSPVVSELRDETPDAVPIDHAERAAFRNRIEGLQIALDREMRKRAQAEAVAHATRTEPIDILVIGDAHADPRHDNERFTWLGRAIVELQPAVVVDIGDWAEMGSLSSYDPIHKLMQGGLRLRDDLDVALDARQRVHAELAAHNKGRRRKYRPELLAALGNHEYRIIRAIDAEPQRYGGLVHTKDLGAEDHGWTVHPYLVPFWVAGVGFCHCWPRPGSSRAVTGVNHGRALLMHFHQTVVQGHSHTIFAHHERGADGRRLSGVGVGGFFSHDPEWAEVTEVARWWRGLNLLKGVADGEIGAVVPIPMDEVRARWSG